MAIKNIPIMKIGIDGGSYNPESGVRSGIERLLSGFLYGLNNLSAIGNRIFFYGFCAKKLDDEKISLRRLPDRLFSTLFLPAWLFIDKVQVYLGFSGVIPAFIRLLHIKTVVFIHDFGFFDHPENYGNPERMQWQTEYALYGADKVIVFSDYIREQALRRFPKLKAEKIVRIYPGADHFGSVKAATTDRANPYFIYVGVIKPAKNILVLLSRFEKLIRLHKIQNLRLILVGPQEASYMSTIKKTVLYQKLHNRIEFKTEITDKKLKELYLGSIGVLNVSHEEGFCYPVVEALTLGKPALVNNIPLYQEFRQYFKGLIITNTEDEFIESAKELVRGRAMFRISDTSPFRWKRFTESLLHEINSFKT